MTISNKRQGLVRAKEPEWPSADVVNRITAELKLDGAQEAALRRTFADIQPLKEQIEDWERSLGSYPEFSRRLQRIEKLLDRLCQEVNKNQDLIEHFLAADIKQALGKIVPASTSWHLEGDAARNYRGLIETLHEPVRKQVALNKRNRGGRSQEWPRNLIIEKLAENSKSIIGRIATPTIPSRRTSGRGSFVALCNAAFNGLQLPTTGLEKAIASKLREMKLAARRAHSPRNKK